MLSLAKLIIVCITIIMISNLFFDYKTKTSTIKKENKNKKENK